MIEHQNQAIIQIYVQAIFQLAGVKNPFIAINYKGYINV
ncbi:hypothetical protein D322_2056 [Yersinia enterocolitica IP 10393]|nr:hypothetical protein D322_2056 [Yersinia enterocolitica IP 10393]